ARTRAFQMRGVPLTELTRWSGVRKEDGAVVMALWADSVGAAEGGCRSLLWAPNIGGTRPWSDTEAGQERRAHCKLGMQQGKVEGMLLYGDGVEGVLPEEKARAVRGIDPDTVIQFQVEALDGEFWATWGKSK